MPKAPRKKLSLNAHLRKVSKAPVNYLELENSLASLHAQAQELANVLYRLLIAVSTRGIESKSPEQQLLDDIPF